MKSTRGSPSVACIAYGLRDNIEPQKIRFDLGRDLFPQVSGSVGPHGISQTAADLIDVAAAVFQIERQLRGRQRTNPVTRFEVKFRVRRVSAWGKEATSTLTEILNLLGYPVWAIRFEGGLTAPIPPHEVTKSAKIEQIALFSGGLDSACGALFLHKERAHTRLTSYYTGQKSLQAKLAYELGFASPVQWTLRWQKPVGRGHSYYYRSFLFLALAAATAQAWRVRRILQFENGVLASAIPPSPSFAMTHHAHPKLHDSCARLFSQLFGGEWVIRNPFLNCTKRECVKQATSSSKLPNAEMLLASTQTCWFYRSNRIVGADKHPNTACGVCVPCLLRRTALTNERFEYDLRKDSVRNHRTKGRAFRSYYGFLSRTLSCKDMREFYSVLPAAGRDLLATGPLSLLDLYKLFRRFATEFMETYDVTPEEGDA